MTTIGLTRSSRPTGTIDIAGTPWPLYKLEALAAGLLVFFAVLVVTGALQPAALAAAGATVVVWWVRRLHWRSPTH
jgi:Flp pilus assembly protein TadB